MATITPLSMIIVQEAMKMLRQTLHMCSFDDIRFTDGKVESQRVQLAKFMRPAGIRERIRTQIRRTPGHLPSPPRHCAPCRPPYRTSHLRENEETTKAFPAPRHTKRSLTRLPPKIIMIILKPHPSINPFFTRIILPRPTNLRLVPETPGSLRRF